MAKRGRPLSFNREQALNAAMLTFWRYGYAGTAIDDLAITMNISAQSLYSAFGSKTELYHEALDYYQQQYCQKIQAPLHQNLTTFVAIKQALYIAASIFSDDSHPRGCMISTANLGCSAKNCAEARYVSVLRKKATEIVQKRIEKGIKQGDLVASIDSSLLANYLCAILQGMSVQAQDGATEKHLIDIAEMCLQSFSMVVK